MKVHNINNLPTIPISDLLPTQGNLKDLSEKNYNKLKNNIERRGFSYPVYVWQDSNDILHLLDGHQRQRVLVTEGWNEPIPYLKVPADNLQEAMARLLEITSQYATITQEGIDEFIAKYELHEADVYEATSFDAIRNYTDNYNPDIDEKENNAQLKTKETVICPACNLEFTP
jgi:ParB-like chromosome segregation protein Spo0J